MSISALMLNSTTVDTSNDTWPSVGVLSDTSRNLIYGGTLIAPRWILTSATAADALTIAGGTTDKGMYITSAGLTYAIRSINTHSSWSETAGVESSNDLALIELYTDINTITPAIVYRYAPSGTARLVGYGPDLIKRTGTTALETIGTNIVSWVYNTGEATVSTGDVGTPLFNSSGEIIGIVSTVATTVLDTCVATRIDRYTNWIAATIYAPETAAEIMTGATCTYDNPEYDETAVSGTASIEHLERTVTWRVFQSNCPKVNQNCSSTSLGYVAASTVCQQHLWS